MICSHTFRSSPAIGCLAVFLVASSQPGCTEHRITLAELREREQAIRAVEPIAIRTSDVALTEMRPYTVGNEDVLIVTIIGVTDAYTPTTVKCRVHSQGQIELPLIGELKVAGLTLSQIEDAILKAHKEYAKNLSVYVELAGPDGTTVLVTGAALRPGLINLPRNQCNVLYALASAGGFGGGASARVRVRSIRSDQEDQSYNLDDINDVRRAMTARPLESGDIIEIEGAPTSAIYVTGLVNAPGAIPLPANSNTSIVRAIYAAGGLRDILDPVEATLVRTLSDGSQAHVKLDLAKIMVGQAEDVQLVSGDILTVPHTLDTRFREWAVANLRIGPFGVGTSYDPVSQYNVNRAIDSENDTNSLLGTLRYGSANLIVPPVTPPATRTTGQ